jgi:ABC-type Mn2+/Zn2+ transport system permease subunit
MIARSSRIKDETAIASLYIVAFALGIILIKYASVKVDLDSVLFGNILGVADRDIWTSFAISAVILLTLIALQRPMLLTLFESSVARTQGIPINAMLTILILLIVLAMLSSLQAVGVLLSLGLLILPAATMYLLSDSYEAMSWGGAILGVAGAQLGLFLSFWANIPSGPAIVMVLGAVFIGAYLFSPKYGVITRALHPRHLHEESLKRWK